MKQSLQLRTSQHLALTPQLQQSIRLLQLSTLELHQELEQMLTDNPLLERLAESLDHATRLMADGALINAPPVELGNTADKPPSEEPVTTEQSAGAEGGEGQENGEQSSFDDGDWNNNDIGRVSKSSDDENSRPQLEANEMTLREYALEQMRLSVRDMRDRALLELL